jgi:hypothetical protein
VHEILLEESLIEIIIINGCLSFPSAFALVDQYTLNGTTDNNPQEMNKPNVTLKVKKWH